MSYPTITSEQAISYILNESLKDVSSIKELESSIKSLSQEVEMGDVTDDDEENYKKDPRYKTIMKAKLKGLESELESLKKRGSNPDGLQPILIFMGNTSMIMQKVITQAKKIIKEDEHYNYDIEFKEIHSSQLTEEFVSNLGKPTGKDGGIIIISDVTNYLNMYDINDQDGLVRNIMVNPFGVISTGWRIIFIEDCVDKSKTFNNSFINYWTKGNLYIYFVEE